LDTTDWQIIYCPNELSGMEFLQALRDLEDLKMLRFTVSGSSGNNPFSGSDSPGHVRVEVRDVLREQPRPAKPAKPAKKARGK